MVGSLRFHAQLFQHKANFTSDAVSLVIRHTVHVPSFIYGLSCHIALTICLEEIELELCTEKEGEACLMGGIHSILQNLSGIRGVGSTIGIQDIGIEPDGLSLVRTPRKKGD